MALPDCATEKGKRWNSFGTDRNRRGSLYCEWKSTSKAISIFRWCIIISGQGVSGWQRYIAYERDSTLYRIMYIILMAMIHAIRAQIHWRRRVTFSCTGRAKDLIMLWKFYADPQRSRKILGCDGESNCSLNFYGGLRGKPATWILPHHLKNLLIAYLGDENSNEEW